MLKIIVLKAPDILCVLVLAFFLGKQISDIKSLDARFSHVDGYSEDHSKEGAINFLNLGFAYSAGLSVWPRFHQDTQVPILLEKKIYTHFYPGPDYVLTAVFALFGINDFAFQWSRLIPLFLFFGAFIYFLYAQKKYMFQGWRWAPVCLSLFILFVPVFKWFVINLHGHGYVTALLFLAFALGLHKTSSPQKIGLTFILCFFIGFVSNYMLLTFAFVVCFAPLVAALMLPEKKNIYPAIAMSFFIGLGLVGAFFVHLWQIAEVVGSWAIAWESQMRIGGVRALVDRGDPVTREMLIGKYSEYTYRFFGISSIAMGVLGLFFVLLQRIDFKIKLKWAAGVLFAFIVSYMWVMALKNHSIDHPHVNPRIFLLLYIVFCMCAVRLLYDFYKDQKKITQR